jgi:hypothetical protein
VSNVLRRDSASADLSGWYDVIYSISGGCRQAVFDRQVDDYVIEQAWKLELSLQMRYIMLYCIMRKYSHRRIVSS